MYWISQIWNWCHTDASYIEQVRGISLSSSSYAISIAIFALIEVLIEIFPGPLISLWWHSVTGSLTRSIALWLLPRGISKSSSTQMKATDNWQTKRFCQSWNCCNTRGYDEASIAKLPGEVSGVHKSRSQPFGW